MVLGEIQHADLTSGTFQDRKTKGTDRYIPARSSVSETAKLKLQENWEPNGEYEGLLATNLLGENESRVLTYSERPPAPEPHDTLKVLYSVGKETAAKAKVTRVIPKESMKTLDAPDLLDDFYCHLLDWSSQNIVAVALGPTIFLWNGDNAKTEELAPDANLTADVTAVRWTKDGTHLAVGDSDSIVSLYDASAGKRLRKLSGHAMRVGSLAWNEHILTSGSKDGGILHHDVRAREHVVATLKGHEQEVCGLEWSPDGSQLASGSNDNTVNIWDGMSTAPKHVLTEHCSAVKALAWCPWQRNVLATGGGSADRQVCLWNASSGRLLMSTDTESQVTDVMWGQQERELVTAHGYSRNHLSVWKHPSLVKVTDLEGHSARIVGLAQSPDGSLICSASADETLRFWKIFSPVSSEKSSKHEAAKMNPIVRTIR